MNIAREAMASGRCQMVGVCDVDQTALTAATDEIVEEFER